MPSQQTSNGSSTLPQASSSPFRVVPPRPIVPPASTAANNTVTPPSPKPTQVAPIPNPNGKKTPNSSRKLMIGVAIAAGALAISFIQIPYEVGGDVELTLRENARQSVHTPIPAVVEQVLVQLGDRVQVGQPLVQLSSRELEREIADVQEKLAQSKQTLERSQQEQVKAEAALIEAVAEEQAVQKQADYAVRRASQLEQGVIPPEIQQLQIEQQRIQGQLQDVAIEIERFEYLSREGIAPRTRLDEQQRAYRNLEQDLAVNAERIELMQRQIKEEATRELSNINYQAASVTASQMIAESHRQVAAHQQEIIMLEERLQHLYIQRDTLTLVATTTGTVITSDLDLLIGREVRPETSLLNIAELSQLTANVEIQEEDLDFVQVGAQVTFRPRQAKLEAYDARVETILPNIKVDETQQKRVATVRLVIDNPQEKLSPGSSGYAKIFSEKIPLYGRVGREIMKLVPERFL